MITIAPTTAFSWATTLQCGHLQTGFILDVRGGQKASEGFQLKWFGWYEGY